MDDPKTRKEKKGRDKGPKGTCYSAKHVRLVAELQEKRTAEAKAAKAKK